MSSNLYEYSFCNSVSKRSLFLAQIGFVTVYFLHGVTNLMTLQNVVICDFYATYWFLQRVYLLWWSMCRFYPWWVLVCHFITSRVIFSSFIFMFSLWEIYRKNYNVYVLWCYCGGVGGLRGYGSTYVFYPCYNPLLACSSSSLTYYINITKRKQSI